MPRLSISQTSQETLAPLGVWYPVLGLGMGDEGWGMRDETRKRGVKFSVGSFQLEADAGSQVFGI